MPYREYKCDICSHTIDRLERVTGSVRPVPPNCPNCNQEMRKLVSTGVSANFKGGKPSG